MLRNKTIYRCGIKDKWQKLILSNEEQKTKTEKSETLLESPEKYPVALSNSITFGNLTATVMLV